jgi:hypothetical protein
MPNYLRDISTDLYTIFLARIIHKIELDAEHIENILDVIIEVSAFVSVYLYQIFLKIYFSSYR